MKTIKAKINFVANDVNYLAGEEIKGLTYDQIVKLNELGYIEPLTYEDLVEIKREMEKPKKMIKEEL